MKGKSIFRDTKLEERNPEGKRRYHQK